jgi:hypothetical protein
MDIKDNEGWAIDICSKNVTHYYKDGVSLCKRKLAKDYFDRYHKEKDYSQVLGFVCTNCQKKLNKK